ncbi:MAG: transporter substrate-binding domain-containing protein [Leptolyngbyaceae cyanobacterium SL_7_1]|nr:transporter substrate-binding domain-containing protein [Leptolyngbyaceae cyanobacterium SL_7_1]
MEWFQRLRIGRRSRLPIVLSSLGTTVIAITVSVVLPPLPLQAITPSSPTTPASPATPSETPSGATDDAVLQVGIKDIPPFVFLTEGDDPYGFSIDLWKEIARELELETEFVPFDDVPTLLEAVKQNRVDVAIAAISITAEREANGLDFSYPIYQSGLQLLVSRQKERGWHSCSATWGDGMWCRQCCGCC